MFGHRGEVASKKLGNVSGWRPRRFRGRGQAAGCASEPCANNERLQPDTDEVPNLKSAATAAIATNAIDKTSSAREIPAAIVPMRTVLIAGTRMRTLNH